MKLEPILFVPDCHIPYHDKRAFALMLKVARDLKPVHIVSIGDFVDFYAVSAHSKDPARSRNLKWELDQASIALDALDKLGAAHKIYVAGNHEDRLTRYARDKAPELNGLINIPDLLHLADRDWQYVPYKRDTKLGKLRATHDVGSTGRNATFSALDTYQHSVVVGHAHRLQYIVEGNAAGETRVAAQFGWLGDIDTIDYMHRVKALKNWALGFGIGYLNPATRYVYLTPVPIVNYTVVVNGKLYNG